MIKTTAHLIFAISLLFLLLSCSQNKKSPLEELLEIGHAMSKHSAIKYSYEINSKTSYSGQNPTQRGIIYFKKNIADTTIGMKYKYITKFAGQNIEIIYDGNYLYTLMKMDSIATKRPLNDFSDGHCTTYPELELSYCAINLFLTDPNIENEIDSLVKIDTLINKKPCTKYSFVANERFLSTHKNYSKNDVNVELIVNNTNLLPAYYSQKENFKSGNQTYTNFSEVKFSRYSFEDNYPTSFFEIESIPSFYNWTKLEYLNQTLPINNLAPKWTLPNIEGDSISLSDYKGKYLLLDFWFIGCGACIQSIPLVNELQNKFNNGRLSVVGINCLSNDVEKIKSFCANQNMNYPNAWNGDSISEAYGINGAPIFYLISPDGHIVYTQFGHDKKMIEKVESIIKKTP